MKSSTAQLCLNSTAYLEIENHNMFHVQKIEVYTGDDDFLETDCIEITAGDAQLTAKHLLTNKKKISNENVRFEAGVRLYIAPEHSDCVYAVTLCHHKGSIVVRAELVPQVERGPFGTV